MKFHFVLALLGIALAAPKVEAATLKSLKEFLGQELSSYKKLTKEDFTLNAAQVAEVKKSLKWAPTEKLGFYFGKSEDGKTQKSCTTVPQEGKEGPMVVGVCFSNLGAVSSVDFLEYNEDRGQAVIQSDFKKQFIGKNASAPFVVGKDIDVVTGASVSSEAVTEAVRKASFFFQNFAKEKL